MTAWKRALARVCLALSAAAAGTAGATTTYRITDLGIGSATDINALGAVVGNLQTPAGSQAFLWSRGQMQAIVAAPYSTAGALNDQGDVVGTFADGGPTKGYVWNATSGMQALFPGSAGGSIATDVNNRGLLVGTRFDELGMPAAWSWSRQGGSTDLAGLVGRGWQRCVRG